jgi:hypothetical protein
MRKENAILQVGSSPWETVTPTKQEPTEKTEFSRPVLLNGKIHVAIATRI